jgi:penicillin-binding protein 1A
MGKPLNSSNSQNKSHQSFRGQRGFSWGKLLIGLIALPVVGVISVVLLLTLATVLANDRLPSMDSLVDYRPKVPLRVYTADNILIGEFGDQRRTVVKFADVPKSLKQGILAAEDTRFFEHSGIDPVGVFRAAISNVTHSGRGQGASTLTMQLARNFFLSSEKTYTRKIYEILLALRIEQSLTKEQIFEIYLNQIFLGQRAYGFGAASQAYFGKELKDITIAEAAMLAGLPKAPSSYNPVVNPVRAKQRQQFILGKMRDLKFITEAEYQVAAKEELKVKSSAGSFLVEADYVAELARQLTHDVFKDDTYSAGLSVYTTIIADEQMAANAALRKGVTDYDRKYGYRGPEEFAALPKSDLDDFVTEKLNEYPDAGDYYAAMVLEASPRAVKVSRGSGQPPITIGPEGLKFVASALQPNANAEKRIRPGAIVRITGNAADQYEIVQLPEVEAALVAINTTDGAVRAMVGGFEFGRNKFNRVTQAFRQPGSTFKPFIYSAALEKGFMTSTLINDAPIFIDAAQTGGQLWEPKNYDGRFDGPMTMRTGLARSKNMVSIRLLQSIGPQYAQDYVGRFGFDLEKNPPYLTLALGAGLATPLQMVGGISVFANGGYRIEPYIIARITDAQGRVVSTAKPSLAGDESKRAIDSRNAYIVDSMLRTVVSRGTADKAKALKRADTAGKTGTTNDSHDAWFAGYAGNIAAVAWVGFDQPRKLGEKETGGGLALPIWLKYMQKALKGTPEYRQNQPSGLIQQGDEVYYSESRPGTGVAALGVEEARPEKTEEVRDQIF